MSCTVYYKGTLKEDVAPKEVYNIVEKSLQNINVDLEKTKEILAINFVQSNSETLIFDFDKKKLNGFWKWNGNDPEEFYMVFDMFIEIKPFFKSLRIDDDEGLWNEYYIQKQPCKVKLRSLNANEMKLLDRIKANEGNPLNEIEKLIIFRSRFNPMNKALLRVIVQDFIEIMMIGSKEDFNPQTILNFANEIFFFEVYGIKRK